MPTQLTFGHIGLVDSAPLVVAQKRGFFAEEGLMVTLSCELGLASICGKLADERLDGACVPAPLPVLLSMGTGLSRVPMRVVSVASWQGIGVVMGMAGSARKAVSAGARIGVVGPGGSSRLLLLKLAQSPGSALGGEPTQVPVAVSQMVDFLKEGMIDGFCAGDPLPAIAVCTAGAKFVSDSARLFAGHIGGVVALRTEKLDGQPGLAAAVERACARARDWCADPARAEEIWRMVLDQAPYADMSKEAKARVIAVALSAESVVGSTLFTLPKNHAATVASCELFLENACRGAAGASIRPADIKAEIARVYPGINVRELIAPN